MTRIKTANGIIDEEVKKIERTIQCPHCNTLLKNVPKYIIQMVCWYCFKEFKIQQDPEQWIFDPDEVKYYRTLSVYSPKE